MPEEPFRKLMHGYKEHLEGGYEPMHAFDLAAFEERIDHWPNGWGEDFVALVYGHFDPPERSVEFRRLGITIESEQVKQPALVTARTVLRARVSIADKSIASVKDAAKRLNRLVGALCFEGRGAPIRWFTFLTHSGPGFPGYRLGDGQPELVLSLIDSLPEKSRRQVAAALYWLREPQGMPMEYQRWGQLILFTGYWNALERLVDAVHEMRPYPKMTPEEKQKAIDASLKQLDGKLTPADVQTMYSEIIRPGFRQLAEHAIRVSAVHEAEQLIAECFQYEPEERGLYAIRNSISHGTADVDDPETTMMVGSRLPKLQVLVFRMLVGVLLLNATPGDSQGM
jgi:hypothetical protein